MVLAVPICVLATNYFFLGMDIFKKFSRRQILSSASILGLGSALSKSLIASTPQAKPISLKKNAVILFQGDSITDARRQNRLKRSPSRKRTRKPQPRKRIIYDDFGEALRTVWQED